MIKYDHIIVGGGLAGSVLALSLIKENRRVLVIDEPSLSSSSKVAAGLFQPMTFKRTAETWKGLESILRATGFYQWAENFLGESFFYPLNMYRIFSSYEEQNNWALKCGDTYFSKLIGEEKNPEADSCTIPFGYGRVFHAGYLDVLSFLIATEQYLKQNNLLLQEKMDFDQLEPGENEISYKEYSACSIIFCEGWLIKNNPWFSYVPMKPVKGEVLTIEIKDKEFSSIISGGLFCVPRKEGGYKVGSNYNWKELNEQPAKEVAIKFKQEISSILNSSAVEIKKHEAGVRPASHDRRPIIGLHPQYKNLLLFNGLGARGVALAPFASFHLIEKIINNSPVPDEMNVARFSRFFHSVK